MTSQVELKLQELGETLPTPPPAVGAYIPVTKVGNLVVTSGQLPTIGKDVMFVGKVGRDVSIEDGQNAARICVLNALAQIKSVIGCLDSVERVVRVEGFVQCGDDFHSQPQVLNGASQLLVDIFGDKGRHTRFAVGTNALPLNAAVELAIWVEVSASGPDNACDVPGAEKLPA
jgi:enamine deaminase RidA (YjgF/YER057c/UK114 family)